MDYVNLGGAGVKVSPIALGLGFRGQASPDEAQRLIEYAIDRGVNLIDCANVYAMLDNTSNVGESETVLGKVLQTKRDDVVITSKVNSRVGQGPNDRGSSRYHIMREVERSLRRLQTDRIDVYLLHEFDATTSQEEAVRALDDLVRQGKIRYPGCSNFTAWQICRGLWLQERIAAAPFICAQNPYSLLNRSPEPEVFGLLKQMNLGLMAYSPLGAGLLSGTYQPGQPPPPGSYWATQPRQAYDRQFAGQTAKVIQEAQAIATQRNKSIAQVALYWVLSNPQVSVAISGSDTIKQLEENLGALGWQLTKEELKRLDEASSPIRQPQ
jgi:aryl-alcohol dehydrogenase-like predicted oxidoreductase